MRISRHSIFANLLFLFTFFIGLFVFSGSSVSTDEIGLFVGAQSLSQRAILSSSPLYWDPTGPVVFGAPGHVYPGFEAAQMVLAAPLHWMARHLPGVGLLHAVWLFNIIVTALSAVLLYRIAFELSGNYKASILLALFFVSTSIALPYARTFFREPLNAFALLLAAFGAISLRQPKAIGAPIYLGTGLALAYAAKTVNFVTGMAILLAALFYARQCTLRQWLWFGSLLAITFIGFHETFQWLNRLTDHGENLINVARTAPNVVGIAGGIQFATTWNAIKGFLLSPGKSVFLYSPLAFVSLVGWWSFFRKQWIFALLCSFIFVFFLFGYSATKGSIWFGGLNWGPRFLVPITPFLLLPALPIIELALARRRFAQLLVAVFALLGLVVQALACLVPLGDYSQAVTSVAPDGMWTLGIYTWKYSPWVLYWQLIHLVRLDFIWMRTYAVDGNIQWWVPALAGFGIIFVLWQIARYWKLQIATDSFQQASAQVNLAEEKLAQLPSLKGGRIYLGAAWWMLAVLLVLTLYNSVEDPRLPGGEDRVRLAERLNQFSRAGDAILLRDAVQVRFFLNTLRSTPPLFSIARPVGKLAPEEDELFSVLLQEYKRIWLISDDTPAVQPLPRANTRPDEAWWAGRAGRVSEEEFSPYTRLSLFLTPPHQPQLVTIEANFDDKLILKQATWERTSEWINGALTWQALQPDQRDYTIFLQLLDDSGTLRWQLDRQPQIGFSPTSTWQTGQIVQDPFALPLGDLQKGSYHLVMGCYWFDADGVLHRLPVKSGADYIELLSFTLIN